MKISLPYEQQDLALLRVPAYVFLASVFLAFVLYYGSGLLERNASQNLVRAQALYEQVQTSVREIADEEATIIRYIDRYRQIAENGTFVEEDRLALIEEIRELRAYYNLFPITLDIGQQGALALRYDPLDLNPGDPVNIRFSEISLNYPLVHEEDLTRLINDVIDEPGLFFPTACAINADNNVMLDFSLPGINLDAQCEILWFTFDLNPPEVNYEY